MGRIFINYRVANQAAYAALLDRELGRQFGASSVFLAPRSIGPGEDFSDAILRSVRGSAVLLAVIGPGWFVTDRPTARRPYGGVDDWVRREIAEAFAAGVRVVPVLVGEADLPVPDELPPDLLPLSRCQAVRLSHHSIGPDLDRLVAVLTRLTTPAAADRSPHLFAVAGTGEPARRIGIVPGDIKGVRSADVWVNSENTDMVMARITDFSVSGIIRYWGARRDEAGHVLSDVIADELAAAVRDRAPVAPATAIATSGGDLARSNGVRYVVHVAAVQGEPGAGFRPVRDVGRCVSSALTVTDRLAATDDRVRSVLFPLLGTGSAQADPGPTAATLLDAAVEYLTATPDTRLRAVLFLASTTAERDALVAAADRPDLTRLPDSASGQWGVVR